MSDIKGLREISNDPFGKLLTSLSKKFSAFLAKDQAELVENPEDVYADGQDVESALKYHNFVMSKQFPISPTNVQYYSPTEPDHDKLTLWLKGSNLGYALRDWSGFEHEAVFSTADPVLVDGAPFDYGIFDATSEIKSIAIRWNRPTSPLVDRESIQVIDLDSTGLRVSGLTIGISYFIRFKIYDLAQQGGLNRTLFEKIEGPTIEDAVELDVSPTGQLRFHLKRSGVDHDWTTAANSILVDTVYEVWCTFAQSGSVIHVYINAVDKALSSTSAPTWQSDTTNKGLWLFQRGSGDTEGYFYGDFYDFMLFREKVVSQTEVTNHYENKWTLADIPFGQVAVSNYSATFGTPLERVSKSMTYKWNVVVTAGCPSFTSTSFTSTSFTT